MISSRRRAALSAVCGLTACGLAAATPWAAAATDDRVVITLTGDIPVRCSIENAGAAERQVDLSRSGSGAYDFEIDCNAPMSVTLRGRSGAFVNTSGAQHSAQFTNRVEYVADFVVDLPEGGADVVVVPESPGSALLGGVQRATEEPPYETTGTLRVRWSRDAARLVAGGYAETFTITVEGAL